MLGIEAGRLVYQKAFRKGLAWVPAGHILRMSPPLIMDEKYALPGLDMIEESITEMEKEFHSSRRILYSSRRHGTFSLKPKSLKAHFTVD